MKVETAISESATLVVEVPENVIMEQNCVIEALRQKAERITELERELSTTNARFDRLKDDRDVPQAAVERAYGRRVKDGRIEVWRENQWVPDVMRQ